MRSIFSAGVLDAFLDNEIKISNVMAVSSGAYAGMNYLSEQRGRVLEAVIKPLETEKYMGFCTFLKKGTFFDMDLLFDEIPKKRVPFDFRTFSDAAKHFVINTVNCLTGEPVYFDRFQDEELFFKICRAANSLPFIARITRIDGVPMLDGGMADAIPISRAMEEGWRKFVVVRTRNAAYRKKQRYFYLTMLRLLYHRYPNFIKLVAGRAERYNQSVELLDRLENEGRAFVFHPPEEIELTNNESNVEKLMEYYGYGYEAVQVRREELLEFVGQV